MRARARGQCKFLFCLRRAGGGLYLDEADSRLDDELSEALISHTLFVDNVAGRTAMSALPCSSVGSNRVAFCRSSFVRSIDRLTARD